MEADKNKTTHLFFLFQKKRGRNLEKQISFNSLEAKVFRRWPVSFPSSTKPNHRRVAGAHTTNKEAGRALVCFIAVALGFFFSFFFCFFLQYLGETSVRDQGPVLGFSAHRSHVDIHTHTLNTEK